ncbi:MAG: alanine racemase [Eubacteriales bacterium]|nr:alanine racemase [Eubacteriales bacterium]
MYKEALRPAWVEIDLSALEYNIRSIKTKVGENVKLIGVVKADSYGHGSVICAKTLREAGVENFAVATLAEAITLRQAGFGENIIILGLTPDLYADTVAEYDLTQVFCTYENAKALNDAAQKAGKTVRGLVGIDTGMGRIGYLADHAEEALKELKMAQKLPNFQIAGVISHFSTADEKSLGYTHGQEQKYRHFIDTVEKGGVPLPFKTLANSAAVMRLPEDYYTAARPGIILYGLYPSHDVDPADLPLKPVMSVKADIVYLKDVPENFSVGYGRKYISRGPAKIATVNVGYADGFPRPYSSAGEVLVHGKRCPIAGNICMDQFMVDVTDIPDVKVGDEVVLMGRSGKEEITADEIADKTGTINYEITCAFGQRLPKIFVR